MLKKRLIFTLLYDNGSFMLSRNFRLQKVGDISWLLDNYEFEKISFAIDELVVLDVSRETRDLTKFCDCLARLSQHCFIPIAAGGGVSNVSTAKSLLRSGADKIVINSLIQESPNSVKLIASEFGQQSIIGSVDISYTSNSHTIKIQSGSLPLDINPSTYLASLSSLPIGELYLHSIERDGTGQGLDFGLLDLLPPNFSRPIILSGGIGNTSHMLEGLSDSRIDAVSTSHLFNFIGDGLLRSRSSLLSDHINLAVWNSGAIMPSVI